MRHASHSIFNLLFGALFVTLLLSIAVGLLSDKPNLSVLACWSFLPLYIVKSFVLRDDSGRDKDYSAFLETVTSKHFWRKYTKEWAVQIAGLLFGGLLFLQWGLPVIGAVGLYLFLFIGTVDHCRLESNRRRRTQ